MIQLLFQENMVEHLYRGVLLIACVIAMMSVLVICARYCVIRVKKGRDEATRFLFRETVVLMMCAVAFAAVMVITGIALEIGGGM